MPPAVGTSESSLPHCAVALRRDFGRCCTPKMRRHHCHAHAWRTRSLILARGNCPNLMERANAAWSENSARKIRYPQNNVLPTRFQPCFAAASSDAERWLPPALEAGFFLESKVPCRRCRQKLPAASLPASQRSLGFPFSPNQPSETAAVGTVSAPPFPKLNTTMKYPG